MRAVRAVSGLGRLGKPYYGVIMRPEVAGPKRDAWGGAQVSVSGRSYLAGQVGSGGDAR